MTLYSAGSSARTTMCRCRTTASYGTGCEFGNVGNLGHEALRAGAHGFASGLISTLDGGKFLSSFVSGAAASGIGSYAQSANIGSGLMVASTTLMGGVVAWATGGDFLQGAMRGMTIGLLNHAMHGNDDIITYSRDTNGNISGEIQEVVVTPSRYTIGSLIGEVAAMNTFVDCIGASLKKNGGNSTFGSNHHLYWHTASERGFYGNQYVSTVRLTTVGQRIVKYTGPIGNVLDGGKILKGVFTDLQDYRNGYTNGYNTVSTTSEAVGVGQVQKLVQHWG